MYLIYKPAEDDVQKFEFKPAKVSAFEAEAVEDATGMDWDDVTTKLLKGNVKARRALLWMMLKRTHPKLKFSDVSFSLGELELQLDLEELVAMREEVENITDDPTRVAALEEIDKQIDEAKAEGQTVPKAE